MPTLLNTKIGTIEPGPTSLFPNCVGAASIAAVELGIEGGSVEFAVGEAVTGGTSGAEGTVERITGVSGVWDADAVTIDVQTGSSEFAVGETVTGGTSGATGEIAEINDLGGDWGAGTGTATLVLINVTGTWDEAAENITGDEGGDADADGVGVVGGTGVATLLLVDVTGDFDKDDEDITGDVAGAAVANGTGAATTIPVNPTDVKGKGIVSVEASSTLGEDGKYTITLRDPWPGLLAVKSCVVSSDTADDWAVTVLSESVATTKQVVIQMLKGGSVAALADTEKLLLELVLATSSMKPVSY